MKRIIPHTAGTQQTLEVLVHGLVVECAAKFIGENQIERIVPQRSGGAAGPLWNNPFDLVFTNEFGRALNHQTVYKHLKRLLRSCGMGDYTFHSLRHSFATISLENGDDIKTVQTNLGHSTASFTLKTYAHVSDQMQRSSAARMEELISSLGAVN